MINVVLKGNIMVTKEEKEYIESLSLNYFKATNGWHRHSLAVDKELSPELYNKLADLGYKIEGISKDKWEDLYFNCPDYSVGFNTYIYNQETLNWIIGVISQFHKQYQ